MSSPLQVGDIIALSQLAWQLGRMFTTERKNAPAKFQEYEDQLYSLSIVLRILTENEALSETLKKDNRLAEMIGNCEKSLQGLEKLLARNSEIKTPKSRRLRDKVIQEWTKIKWTQKDGELDALTSNIATHYRALNGVLSVIGAGRLEDIQRKIDEMYRWLTEILQRSRGGASPAGQEPLVRISEKLSQEDHLLCPRARIRVECLEEHSTVGSRIFDCYCDSVDHTEHVESLSILPKSIVVRSADVEPAWIVSVHSSFQGRTVELKLTACSVFSMKHLEAFISRFAFRQGMSSTRYSDSLSAYRSATTAGDEALYVTKAKGEVFQLCDQIEGIIFQSTGNGGKYFAQEIESMHLLHYFVFRGPQTASDGVDSRYAELVIFDKVDSFDAHPSRQFIVRIKYDTRIDLESTNASVCISNVCCVQESGTGRITTEANVELIVKTSDAAHQFVVALNRMKAELWISYLRGPRAGEKIAFTRSKPEWTAGECRVLDASISGVVDEIEGRERLVVSDGAGSTYVCIESSECPSQAQSGSDDVQEIEMHVVQISPDRITITEVEDPVPFANAGGFSAQFLN
ncbi:hypothetical protein IWZ00DRAFT_20603 [Phyllosticta capitalensis]